MFTLLFVIMLLLLSFFLWTISAKNKKLNPSSSAWSIGSLVGATMTILLTILLLVCFICGFVMGMKMGVQHARYHHFAKDALAAAQQFKDPNAAKQALYFAEKSYTLYPEGDDAKDDLRISQEAKKILLKNN